MLKAGLNHQVYLTETSDANDESLRKWKQSLGLGGGKDLSDPKDPRTCIILSLGLEVTDLTSVIGYELKPLAG